jgi:hypothetical protein
MTCFLICSGLLQVTLFLDVAAAWAKSVNKARELLDQVVDAKETELVESDVETIYDVD